MKVTGLISIQREVSIHKRGYIVIGQGSKKLQDKSSSGATAAFGCSVNKESRASRGRFKEAKDDNEQSNSITCPFYLRQYTYCGGVPLCNPDISE